MAVTRIWQAHAELGGDGLVGFTSRDSTSFNTTSTTKARTGTHSFRLYSNYGYSKVLPSTYTQFRLSCHWNHNGAGSGDTVGIIAFGSVVELRWVQDASKIQLYVNGSLADEVVSSEFAQTDIWRHLGIDVKIAASGWAYVYLDGAEVIGYSGDLGTVGISSLEFNPFIGSLDSWNGYVYIDDIFLDDINGETNPAAVPDKRFYYRRANGNGTASELTGSDGDSLDNYLLVDDVPHDGDGTYVKAAAAGLRDLYDTETFTLPANFAVAAVIPLVVAKKTDAAIGTQVKLVAKNGASETVSSAKNLGTSYGVVLARMTTQPGGGSWDEAGVNAAEYGMESAGAFS